MQYFESQGWTKAQAAGIVGNLIVESNLNTKAVGDGGAAHGIAQWHPDRQATFQSLHGVPMLDGSLQQQLSFVQYELTHSEAGAARHIRAATSAAAAAAAVDQYYERSSGAARQQRIQHAERLAQ